MRREPQTVNTTDQHTERGVNENTESILAPNIAVDLKNVNGANPAMGAADYGFSPYSNYQNTQSEFLPEGANAAWALRLEAERNRNSAVGIARE